MKKISFVIPCYRSQDIISEVVDKINAKILELGNYEHEIILVCDNSPDGTYAVIKEICKRLKMVKGINLAKNFGQHGAIMAGLNQTTGDYIVLLDDDGQTPPSELHKLLNKLEEGFDVVFAKYENKRHSIIRNIGSQINDKMATIMIGKHPNLFLSSYVIMKKYIRDEIIKYKNPYPYMSGLILRTTSNVTNVSVEHKSRITGVSGYNMKKLIGLWLNGFTSFSVFPLRLASFIGFTAFLIGLLGSIWILVNKLINPTVPMGWSSNMLLTISSMGLIMLSLGILGEYIGRIYILLNNSPQYVIKEKTSEDADNENNA